MIFPVHVALLSAIVSVTLANAIPADPTITADIAEAARCGLDWVGEGQRNLYAFICCKLSADETYRLKGLHNHAMLVTHGTNLVSRPTAFTVQISDHYLGDYAQCCAETLTACPAPTACVRGSQIYPFSGTTITTAW
jgi:hypothetical protein